jgi:hypothetical protein
VVEKGADAQRRNDLKIKPVKNLKQSDNRLSVRLSNTLLHTYRSQKLGEQAPPQGNVINCGSEPAREEAIKITRDSGSVLKSHPHD